MPKDRVAYYYAEDVGHRYYGPGHPMKPFRIKLAHHLILSYGLYRKMECYRPHKASAEELASFHSDDYIDFLRRVSPVNAKAFSTQMQKFNCGEYTDCPVFANLYDFCQTYAGASIDGAVRLNHGLADVAVNWAGGLHHAKKCEASGFCYVNDIVLAILELLKYHPRVLYIDIDVHHGDGVEEAFYTTDRVMCVSFHRYGDFFPGTGALRDVGAKTGKYYSVNFPLNDGIDDDSYESIFKPIIQKIMESYQPGAVVLQCGADSLTGDRLGGFNLTLKGHAECVRFVRSFGIPTMVLGGGGYTIRNVARCWANETATVLGETLPDYIPPNDFVEFYRPDYRLHLDPSPAENLNSREYLNKCRNIILENLRYLEAAPGVAFQDVPPDWAVRHVEDALKDNGGSKHPDIRPGAAGSGASGALGLDGRAFGIDGRREHEAEFYDGERDNDQLEEEEENEGGGGQRGGRGGGAGSSSSSASAAGGGGGGGGGSGIGRKRRLDEGVVGRGGAGGSSSSSSSSSVSAAALAAAALVEAEENEEALVYRAVSAAAAVAGAEGDGGGVSGSSELLIVEETRGGGGVGGGAAGQE